MSSVFTSSVYLTSTYFCFFFLGLSSIVIEAPNPVSILLFFEVCEVVDGLITSSRSS